MVHNPCNLLARLLQEKTEGGWLEFKVNNANPDEIGEYVSALGNGAMLADRDRAYLVFGVDDKSRKKVGTTIRLQELRKGNEPLAGWLSRMIEPRLYLELLDFDCDGLQFSILTIEPTYDRPVKFSGAEYIRIGESKKPLLQFPQHERALWIATGRRKFEDAIALQNKSESEILKLLDVTTLYNLIGSPNSNNPYETVRKLSALGCVVDNMEGGYDITNLGAILLARDIGEFPSISHKSLRIVRYTGRDKSRSDIEQEGRKGYAVGFSGMIRFIMSKIPSEERYIDGIRRMVPHYPETAIREVLANALIHQDFTISGAGPVVEIYNNRVEIISQGNCLIETDRILDERRSRNEKLASTMRELNLCEERGGGLDKSMIEIEKMHLPAPEFNTSEHSMRVVLFGPKSFSKMSKQEKQRACFYHCVLRWITHDYMGNSSLRDRFLLPQDEYQAVSAVISEAVRAKRIVPADPQQGKRNAKYVPYWVG